MEGEWLEAAAVTTLKRGAAVEVAWTDGRTARYELTVEDGVTWVASEDTRGRSESTVKRLWLPLNLKGGDRVRPLA